MATSLPRNWFVTTHDETRVVRATSAGMILSDSTIDPTLYDHNTAVKVAQELGGMLSLGGVIVNLMAKSKNLSEEHKQS